MLKHLSVKSFAIIEDLSLDFSDGMTVLTGETGAGKSLIIDTISLLLGARADSDMIRYQDEFASIYGIFTYDNKEIDDLLNEYMIKKKDNQIEILREIYQTSKNVIKINGISVNLNTLKMIASNLADIHVQHDTYRLFNPETYLSFIDPTDDQLFQKKRNDYVMALIHYQNAIANYTKIKKGRDQSIDKLEYLQFEKEELSSLKLEENIDVTLDEEINKLANYDKIFQTLSTCYDMLENDSFNPAFLYDASKELKKISDYDSNYLEYSEKLYDGYYAITDVKKEIASQIASLDFDQNEFDMLISRLDEINKAKAKYKKSVKELIAYLKEITLEIEMVTNYDSLLLSSEEDVKKAFASLKEKAISLTDYRKKISKEIEKAIVLECADLELSDTVFEIKFFDVDYSNPFLNQIFTESGVDKVDFMISLNKGEPVKPLSKTASGGELSRIMLAFKSHFSKKSALSLMVFDEIDTGISGSTATQIAKKIHNISEHMQVLCITHMPQVAAIGDQHLYIYKETESNRTRTKIENLGYDARIEKIAIMLSGKNISKFALEHAKHLLGEKQ